MWEAQLHPETKYEVIANAVLGEGTYGKVYKAKRRLEGDFVAIKKMKIDSDEEGVPSNAIREVALLRELSHENVVKLQDVYFAVNKLVLVFEFVEGDLKTYMKSVGGKLKPSVIKSLSFQLCRGIEFCHGSRILHRDLKPENLLIDGELRLKIADFGLARAYSVPVPKYTHEVVTVWYRAPEILLGACLYSLPVDLWSIGCIFGEMVVGMPLFPGGSEIDTLFMVFKQLGTPTLLQWPGLTELPDFKPTFPQWRQKAWESILGVTRQVGTDGTDLIEKLLVYNPNRRLSARRALQHPFFADVEKATPKD